MVGLHSNRSLMTLHPEKNINQKLPHFIYYIEQCKLTLKVHFSKNLWNKLIFKVFNIEKVQNSIIKVNCYVWLLKIHSTLKKICTILNRFKTPRKKNENPKINTTPNTGLLKIHFYMLEEVLLFIMVLQINEHFIICLMM